MNASTPPNALDFRRSEAFLEDVVEFVAPPPTAAAPRDRRAQWLLVGLVPAGLAAAAIAAALKWL